MGAANMIDIAMFIFSGACIIASVVANVQIEKAMNKIADEFEGGKLPLRSKKVIFRA